MTNLYLIILTNLLVFWRTLRYSLVIDDRCRYLNIEERKGYKTTLWRVLKNWTYSGHCDINIQIDHLCTIFLHTTTCCMIYIAFGESTQALLASLLFSVLPVNNQVSIWLNGKRYACNAILVLAMWYMKPLGWVFWLFTPLWNINAFMAPMLFLRTQWWWLAFTIPLFLLIGWNTIYKRWLGRIAMMPEGEIRTIAPRKLKLVPKAFGYYFWHCIFPRDMAFYHMLLSNFGHSEKDNKECYALDAQFWVGVVTLAGVLTTMALNWHNPLGLGLFWYLVFLAQYLHFPISVTQAIAERNTYIANIGLMWAVSYLCLTTPILFPILFTYYLTKLWNFMPAYKDLYNFYGYSLHTFPDHFRARAHRAKLHLEQKQYFFAVRECAIGLYHRPTDCRLNILMAQALINLGMFGDAEVRLKTVEDNLVIGQEQTYSGLVKQCRGHMDKTRKERSTK